MKLLVGCQRLIIHVKVRMCIYCFIRVSDDMLVFVMILVCMFGIHSMRNRVAGVSIRWILYMDHGQYGFVCI